MADEIQKTIYVIEDDESIRMLIKLTLESFSYDVKDFEKAENAIKEASKKLPDLFIFDIMLPGISGIVATKKLRDNNKTKDIPIILLTAKGTEIDKVTGLDSGADDYIVKPFSAMELAARIRAIFRRKENKKPNSPQRKKLDIYKFDNLLINNDTREITIDGAEIHLSFKEYEVLRILAEEKDRIVKRDELLDKVWGASWIGETRTLDMHIKTLRNKLNDDAENPKFIKTVRGIGYRFVGK